MVEEFEVEIEKQEVTREGPEDAKDMEQSSGHAAARFVVERGCLGVTGEGDWRHRLVGQIGGRLGQ